MTGMKIGYARVSTNDLDLTALRKALLALGVEDKQIFVEHGRAVAMTKGRRQGKQPKFSKTQREYLLTLHDVGERAQADIGGAVAGIPNHGVPPAPTALLLKPDTEPTATSAILRCNLRVQRVPTVRKGPLWFSYYPHRLESWPYRTILTEGISCVMGRSDMSRH